MPEDKSAGKGYTYTKDTFTPEMLSHILESKEHDEKKRQAGKLEKAEWIKDGERGMFGTLPCMSDKTSGKEEKERQINALLEQKFGKSPNKHINTFKEKYDQGLANSGTMFLMKQVNFDTDGFFDIFSPNLLSFEILKNNDDKIEVTVTATDHGFTVRSQSTGCQQLSLKGSIISVFTLGLQNNSQWELERVEFSNSIIDDLACKRDLVGNFDDYPFILEFARIEEELWVYIENMTDPDLKKQAISVLEAAVQYRRAHPEQIALVVKLINYIKINKPYAFFTAIAYSLDKASKSRKTTNDHAIYLQTMINLLDVQGWDTLSKESFVSKYQEKTKTNAGFYKGHFNRRKWKPNHVVSQVNVIRHMQPGNTTCESENARQIAMGSMASNVSSSGKHGFFGGHTSVGGNSDAQYEDGSDIRSAPAP